MIVGRFKLLEVKGESPIKQALFEPQPGSPDLGNVPPTMVVSVPIKNEASLAQLCVGRFYTMTLALSE